MIGGVTMRVLLLEDEEAIRGFVRINLKRNGMDVVEAETGEDALAFAEQAGPFDIALLDVMLPTISGFEVCERMRELYPRMGIIMLTAKSQEEDKIHGLELGADDYVQKPFSPGELIARMKSLYRRMYAEIEEAEKVARPQEEPAAKNSASLLSAEQIGRNERDSGDAAVPGGALRRSDGLLPAARPLDRFEATSQESVASVSGRQLHSGIYRLSIAERKFWRGEEEIILTPTEWALVRLLMENGGQSVSRDHILTEVWGRFYVGDLKVVDVNIRRIRQKLEPNPSLPETIETVWGFGYRWKRSVTR